MIYIGHVLAPTNFIRSQAAFSSMLRPLLTIIACCTWRGLAVVEHAGQIPEALSGEPFTNISTYAIDHLYARELLLERQTCYSPNVYCPGRKWHSSLSVYH